MNELLGLRRAFKSASIVRIVVGPNQNHIPRRRGKLHTRRIQFRGKNPPKVLQIVNDGSRQMGEPINKCPDLAWPYEETRIARIGPRANTDRVWPIERKEYVSQIQFRVQNRPEVLQMLVKQSWKLAEPAEKDLSLLGICEHTDIRGIILGLDFDHVGIAYTYLHIYCVAFRVQNRPQVLEVIEDGNRKSCQARSHPLFHIVCKQIDQRRVSNQGFNAAAFLLKRTCLQLFIFLEREEGPILHLDEIILFYLVTIMLPWRHRWGILIRKGIRVDL